MFYFWAFGKMDSMICMYSTLPALHELSNIELVVSLNNNQRNPNKCSAYCLWSSNDVTGVGGLGPITSECNCTSNGSSRSIS